MPDSGGVGRALIERLEKRGVEVLSLEPGQDSETLEKELAAWVGAGELTGLYWLPALDAHAPVADMDDATWKDAVERRVKALYTSARAV